MFPTQLNTRTLLVSVVDPEYGTRDARAVEDPIAAIFDLAESVDAQTPKIRKTLRYVRIFVSVWLLLDFVLMMALSAISPGGSVAATFLLFIPIVGLLLGMRLVSQASTRLALLILACVLGAFQAIKRGVEDVSLATRIPPARVLAVWKPGPGATIAPEAYDFLVRETIRVKIRGAMFACSLELVSEGADGTYDFIPVVVDTGPRVQPAVSAAAGHASGSRTTDRSATR